MRYNRDLATYFYNREQVSFIETRDRNTQIEMINYHPRRSEDKETQLTDFYSSFYGIFDVGIQSSVDILLFFFSFFSFFLPARDSV